MLTSKQRARLRALANPMETIMQVGKGGVTPQLAEEIGNALTARELIKLRALETCPTDPRTTAMELAQATGAQVVQVIGTRFVLYRPNPKKPVIQLD